LERTPVLAANQLAVQVDTLGTTPDQVVLAIGHASPPVLVGTEDEQRVALNRIGEVSVMPVARVSVSVGRLKEWAKLLTQTAEKLETYRQDGGQS
jgi:hypothetical protein